MAESRPRSVQAEIEFLAKKPKYKRQVLELLSHLAPSDRRAIFLELVAESGELTDLEVPKEIEPEAEAPTETYTERAERFVLSHPEGVSTREVADALAQPPAATDSTLRHIMRSRHTIERRDNRWFPTTNEGTARKPPLRDLIVSVMRGKGEMAHSAIVAAVLAQNPDRNGTSVGSEVYRSRDDGVIVAGSVPGTYKLAEGEMQ